MCLAQRFYDVLVEVLRAAHELDLSAGQLQTDRTIAYRFHVSESTARNWRRCKHSQIAPATLASILHIVQDIAPLYVPQLEFLDRLQRGTQDVKTATETLVDRLSDDVLSRDANWHIYSGPLRMAFDLGADQGDRQALMSQSATIMERILEMNIDQSNIPSISELVRYSTHGWYLKGLLKIREASLSSRVSGIQDGTLSVVEAALYIGDGCATPSFISGDPNRAMRYSSEALKLLQSASRADEAASGISIRDATIMVRSIEVIVASYSNPVLYQTLIDNFRLEIGGLQAEIDWIEGTRQEALGCIELARREDFAKAAHHFRQAGQYLDRWIARFGIPFSTTSPQSLLGYSLLMSHGPTDGAKLNISEGLLRTIDLGNVAHQIRARVCEARLYEYQGDATIAAFHGSKALELVQQYNLSGWYAMLNSLLPSPPAPR